MDALRCPPDDADVDDAVGRREATRRTVPAAAAAPRPAAPRRADEPPRCRVGRVARALPQGIQRHRRRRHARPLLPGQRRAVDPRARPGEGHPVRRQLFELARAEARTDVARAEAGRRAAAHARARARMGAHGREGATGQGQGPTERVREAARGGDRRARRPAARTGDRHPTWSSAGRDRHRGPGTAQGLRRSAADRGPDVLAAARRDRWHHRPERRGQDDAVPHARRPGGTRRGHDRDRRHGQAELRRPEPR